MVRLSIEDSQGPCDCPRGQATPLTARSTPTRPALAGSLRKCYTQSVRLSFSRRLPALVVGTVLVALLLGGEAWGCSYCAMTVVIDRFPFAPLWLAGFLVWGALKLSRKKDLTLRQTLGVSGGVGLGFGLLTIVPVLVYVAALAIAVWVLRLACDAVRGMALADWRKQRSASFRWIAIAGLAASVPLCYRLYGTPTMLVQRLGDPMMAPRAREGLLLLHDAGCDVSPLLLQGLDGEGHYWIQASGSYRRGQAVELLGDLRDARAVPHLTAIIQMSQPDVFSTGPALKALGTIRTREAIDALIAEARTGSMATTYYGGRALASSLKMATGQDFDTDWPRWRAWWRAHRPLSGS